MDPNTATETLGVIIHITPFVYIGLLIYCLVLAITIPGTFRPDLNIANKKILGLLMGVPVFILFIIYVRWQRFEPRSIDFAGIRMIGYTIAGFIVGIILLEIPRVFIRGKNHEDTFYAFFIMLVVALSLIGFYIYYNFEQIRAVAAVFATAMLIGIGVDAIGRSNILNRGREGSEKIFD